jgi:hypothetical protein
MKTKPKAKVVAMDNTKNPFDGYSKVERQKPSENDTPTMNNRIMPKKDFERVIEHDKIYLSALHQEMEFRIIKQAILAEKCEPIMANQTRDKIINNIDTLISWAETKKLTLDLKAQIVAQERLVQDKENHFNHVFLKQYEVEIAECRKSFNEIYTGAIELTKSKPLGSEEIVTKLLTEFAWWDKLPKEEQKEEERQLQLFKPIKRLYNAWLRVLEDSKEQ